MKPNAARTDTGRLSRAKHPGEAPDVLARRARARHHGIPYADTATAEAGSVIGRLSFMGQAHGGISRDQYDALKTYNEHREQYYRAIQAPDSLLRASEAPSGTWDEDTDAESRNACKKRFMSAQKAIQEAQNEYRIGNLWAAIEYLVIKDMLFAHMIGDLRLAANALVRHYGLDKVRKAG